MTYRQAASLATSGDGPNGHGLPQHGQLILRKDGGYQVIPADTSITLQLAAQPTADQIMEIAAEADEQDRQSGGQR